MGQHLAAIDTLDDIQPRPLRHAVIDDIEEQLAVLHAVVQAHIEIAEAAAMQVGTAIEVELQ